MILLRLTQTIYIYIQTLIQTKIQMENKKEIKEKKCKKKKKGRREIENKEKKIQRSGF